MSSERIELGRGIIFSATLFEKYNKVAKFTAFPWNDLHNPETEAGSGFLERMQHDHHLIREYLGEDCIKGTHIVRSEKLWWVEQEFYPESPVACYHPLAETLKGQLEDLAEKSKRMYSETGFALDWLGFGMWEQMPKVLGDKNFWTFPSLKTVKDGNQSTTIRIQDTGLLWTKTRSLPKVMVLPHENLAWIGNKFVLNMIQKRTGVDFLK